MKSSKNKNIIIFEKDISIINQNKTHYIFYLLLNISIVSNNYFILLSKYYLNNIDIHIHSEMNNYLFILIHQIDSILFKYYNELNNQEVLVLLNDSIYNIIDIVLNFNTIIYYHFKENDENNILFKSILLNGALLNVLLKELYDIELHNFDNKGKYQNREIIRSNINDDTNLNSYINKIDKNFIDKLEKNYSEKENYDHDNYNNIYDYIYDYIETIIYKLTPIERMEGGVSSNKKYQRTDAKITVLFNKKKYTRTIYINNKKKYVKINKVYLLLSKLKKIS
jgi:hypothetical protein